VCIYVNIYTHTSKLGAHTCKYVYIHTQAQTQIRMHVFLCAHSVSVCTYGVFHVYIYKCIYLHTHIKHIRKQDTNTDMYACICMHTLCMHTQCLFIHICIDVHTYTHTYKPRYVHIYLHAHTLHLYAPTFWYTHIFWYTHPVSVYICIYTRTHVPTCTNTDMCTFRRMNTQCIGIHTWCPFKHICIHSYTY